MKAPFFIIGCPRSGTTLLQVLLDSHPHISIPPESHIFERFSELFSYYGELKNRSNLELLVGDILQDIRIKDWNLEISVNEFCNCLKVASIRGVISLLFELYAEKEGKIQWGDKTPQHMFYLEEIKAVFPEAKFIHLVRDGRDIAESLSRVFIGPQSIDRITQQWKKYILTFNQFKKNLDSQDFLEVRYEDLVRNQDDVLNLIFNFLDEKTTDVINIVPNTNRKQQYLQLATHHRSLSQSITDQKIGTFKEVFSPRKIEIFEAIAGEQLKSYEYSLLTPGVTQIKLHEKLSFFMADYCLRYLRKFSNLEAAQLFSKQIHNSAQLKIRRFLRSRRHPQSYLAN